MCAQLSLRGQVMPASPIRKLVPFADEAKARGVHVYHLNIGQPDIESPERALAALETLQTRVIAYSHSQGEAGYLEALISYYARFGIALERSNINVTTGGSEAILFALLITMNPGEEVLVPEPFYTNYNAFAQVAGVVIKPITTQVNDGFHLPSMEQIESLIGPQTKAILLCNPSNPTGTVYRREEIDGIVQIAQRHDLWILSDEVYREFVFEPREGDYQSLLQLRSEGLPHLHGADSVGTEQGTGFQHSDLAERVIMMDSISKRYSMCGARIGCLVSRNKEVMDAALRLAQARLSSPQVEQRMALAAHGMPDTYLPEIVDVYRGRRDVVFEALQAMPGVTCTRPEGAFYTIPELPIDNAERFARWLLTDFSFEGETVMVAPAAGFYATPGLGTQQIRIAFVLEEASLARAMQLLERALATYRQTML